MARLGVDSCVFSDPRFDLLGQFLESNRYEAIGRMLLVWNACQEKNTYTLPEVLVSAIFGHRDGSSWVVKSGLAEWVDTRKKTILRIRGTQGRIEWLAAKRQTARLNGLRGGRPRNQNKTNIGYENNQHRLQPETPTTTATTTNTKIIVRAKKPARTYTEDFLAFWLEYPRKEAKGEAFSAWESQSGERPPLAEVLAAVARYRRCKTVKEGYVKLPATWLNKKCWEDEPMQDAEPEPAPGSLEALIAANRAKLAAQ